MNETMEEIEIRDALTRSLHSEDPSDDLMRKLRSNAQASAKNSRRVLSTRFTFAAAAGVGALALAITMLPAKASAKTYGRLLAAAQRVNAFQFSVDTVEDGKPSHVRIAGVDGRISIHADEGTLVQVDKDGLQVYDPEENTITRLKFGGFMGKDEIVKGMKDGIGEGLKNMDLKKMLREWEQKYGKDHTKISKVHWLGDREVYEVDLETPQDPEKVHMVVEAATDLPREIIVDKRGPNGVWSHETTLRMQFGGEVPESALKIRFPANAKVEEIDLSKMIVDGGKHSSK